jgi:hypothetical protein
MQTVRASTSTSGSGVYEDNSQQQQDMHIDTNSGIQTDHHLAIEQHVYNTLASYPLFVELFRPENPRGLVHVSKELAMCSNNAKINHLMQLLRRPLYSTEMIAWAKNNRMDLLKVEKKMQELISGYFTYIF